MYRQYYPPRGAPTEGGVRRQKNGKRKTEMNHDDYSALVHARNNKRSADAKTKRAQPVQSGRKWGALVAKPRVQGNLDGWVTRPDKDQAPDGRAASVVHEAGTTTH